MSRIHLFEYFTAADFFDDISLIYFKILDKYVLLEKVEQAAARADLHINSTK